LNGSLQFLEAHLETIPDAGLDRRRSDRIEVDVTVRLAPDEGAIGLEGTELVRLVELSLGGATLETASRPRLLAPRRMELGFETTRAGLTVRPYRLWLHQLFYAPQENSRVRYRVRVTFPDPSIDALNLIYRILLAHWKGEG
jgi:hypothetical protein